MVFTTRIKWAEEIPKIRELGMKGSTMSDIAELYGVSRQRVKQIIDKFLPNWHDNCGQVVKRREKADSFYLKHGDKQPTELYRTQKLKFSRKKANAKRIGWEWSIDFGDLHWPTHCPILGMELDYFAESAQENSPSFDQVDAGKGYVKGNVVIMSWRANRIKSNGMSHEHRAIADYLDKLAHS